MHQYRLFFKKLTNLGGRAIGSKMLKSQTYTIRTDCLSNVMSSFTCYGIPNAVQEGDVCGVYDDYGNIFHYGIITRIDPNTSTLEMSDITAIFDDEWLWNNPAKDTIEETIKAIIQQDFQTNIDTLLVDTFKPFTIEVSSATAQVLATQKDQYTTNFQNFIFEMYEKYGVLVTFEIPFESANPKIIIGKAEYPKIKISNNNNSITNFSIVTETYETNKLIIYSKDGEYRKTYYTTTNGITTDPSSLNRLQKINTEIVFSDDEEDTIVADKLPTTMYNHKITLDLLLTSTLYKWEDLHLGQEFEIYYDGNIYQTILTGTERTQSEGQETGYVTLTFGIVRTGLIDKIKK